MNMYMIKEFDLAIYKYTRLYVRTLFFQNIEKNYRANGEAQDMMRCDMITSYIYIHDQQKIIIADDKSTGYDVNDKRFKYSITENTRRKEVRAKEFKPSLRF